MGNIKAHRTVATAVMNLLDRVRPDENHMFFALGNSLTDLSQVCDPPAHASGKIATYRKARESTFGFHFVLKHLIDLDGYLDALFGKSGGNGKLAEVLLFAVYAKDLEKFRKETPGISPEVFHQLFWPPKAESDGWYQGLSQYWPHEHLDFPPWPYADVIGERSQSSIDVHRCYAPAGTVDGSPAATAAQGGTCWFELRVVDELTGNPVGGVELTVKLPNGITDKFRTQPDGALKIGDIPPGTVDISCSVEGARLNQTLHFMKSSPVAPPPGGPGVKAPPAGCRILNIRAELGPERVTLKQIAGFRGLDWKTLALFNFGTCVPSAVNRALKSRVGCRTYAPDRVNYMLTGKEEPGVIFVPEAWSLGGLKVDEVHVVQVRSLEFPPTGTAREAALRVAEAGTPLQGSSAPAAATPVAGAGPAAATAPAATWNCRSNSSPNCSPASSTSGAGARSARKTPLARSPAWVTPVTSWRISSSTRTSWRWHGNGSTRTCCPTAKTSCVSAEPSTGACAARRRATRSKRN
jgi:hypothetical protein